MISNSWVRKLCQTKKFNIFVYYLSLHFFANVLKKQAHSEFTSDIGHEVWPPTIPDTKIDDPYPLACVSSSLI